MFGLFKSSTPETRLAADVKKSLEQEVAIAVKETKGNDFIAGYAIELGISNVYKAYKENVTLLAAGHNISKEKVLTVIKDATNEVRNKYLVNPTPID